MHESGRRCYITFPPFFCYFPAFAVFCERISKRRQIYLNEFHFKKIPIFYLGQRLLHGIHKHWLSGMHTLSTLSYFMEIKIGHIDCVHSSHSCELHIVLLLIKHYVDNIHKKQ